MSGVSANNKREKRSLQLSRPDIIRNIPNKLQLLDHPLAINEVTLTVTSKATLRANTNLIKRLLQGNPVTLSNELSGIIDALLHLLLVLELGELGGHDTEDDVLVAGQLLERLEAAGARGVVFEVVGVDVEFLEELGGDTVVAALREVARADEVAAAEVDADVEVGGPLGEAVVVQLDVFLEGLVGAVLVELVFLPALEHLVGAEVCFQTLSVDIKIVWVGLRERTSKVRVVELDVTATSVVQDLDFVLVGLGNVGEVLIDIGVDVLGEGEALAVAQVVPVRGSKSDLQVLDLLGGNEASEVLELVDICAADVLDLACAEDALAGLVASLEEGGDIGGVGSEDIWVRVLDLIEPVEAGEEGAPEHCPQGSQLVRVY